MSEQRQEYTEYRRSSEEPQLKVLLLAMIPLAVIIAVVVALL